MMREGKKDGLWVCLNEFISNHATEGQRRSSKIGIEPWYDKDNMKSRVSAVMWLTNVRFSPVNE